MRICFETTVEDWAAVQVYGSERLEPLKRFQLRHTIKLLVWFGLITGLLYWIDDGGRLFGFYVTFVVVWVVLTLLGLGKRRQKRLFKQLCQIYRQAFDGRGDKRATWEVDDKQLAICDNGTWTLIPWSNINQVVLLPQFMFIRYGALGWAYLPKRQFIEGDCLSFTHQFLSQYRTFAYEQGAAANIIQEEKTFKLSKQVNIPPTQGA